ARRRDREADPRCAGQGRQQRERGRLGHYMGPDRNWPASGASRQHMDDASVHTLNLLEQLAERGKHGSAPGPKAEPPSAPSAPDGPGVRDSIRKPATAGWIIIGLFFGVFGTWSVIAPLHGAVVANAFVKVEGNRKSVQHLDGGIVKELHVKEGDRVGAGDVLIVLDDNQARAEYDVLYQQYLVLRATEERLKAELVQAPGLAMPPELKPLASDAT